MFDSWTEQEKEWLAIGSLLLGFSAGGALSIGVLLHGLQVWLVEIGWLLTGTAVQFPMPWDQTVGLDLARLIILVGAFLALLVAGALAVRWWLHRARATQDLRR